MERVKEISSLASVLAQLVTALAEECEADLDDVVMSVRIMPEGREVAEVSATDIIAKVQALIDTPLSPTAVDGSPAPEAGSNDEPAVYLIRKYGGYYRPNCQGYTRIKEEAGRYTLAEAISESHPNGPDGPRDGMTYIHEDDVLPLDAGGKEGV